MGTIPLTDSKMQKCYTNGNYTSDRQQNAEMLHKWEPYLWQQNVEMLHKWEPYLWQTAKCRNRNATQMGTIPLTDSKMQKCCTNGNHTFDRQQNAEMLHKWEPYLWQTAKCRNATQMGTTTQPATTEWAKRTEAEQTGTIPQLVFWQMVNNMYHSMFQMSQSPAIPMRWFWTELHMQYEHTVSRLFHSMWITSSITNAVSWGLLCTNHRIHGWDGVCSWKRDLCNATCRIWNKV